MRIEPVPPAPEGQGTPAAAAELAEEATAERAASPFQIQASEKTKNQPAAAAQTETVMPRIQAPVEPQEQVAQRPATAPPAGAANSPVAGTDTNWMMVYTTPDYWVAPRFSVRRSFGDGVGYDQGYTYLEAFTPFLQDAGSSLFFANNRVVNYDNGSFWEFQTGGGARRLLPELGVVAGLNAFYDGRNTDYDFFHQLGLGWEALGAVWEWRGNVYIPIGQQRASIGSTGFFNPQFVTTHISLDQFLFFENAMGGVDTEVGRALIVRDALNLRGYVGFYHYSNDQVQTANGIRGRLEAWLGENLSLNLAVQNDAVFDTTVTGGLALHLGGLPRGLRRVAALESKLGNRVVRDPNIVVQRTQQFRRELAIDPASGAPIEVRHASSDAAPGGDGSVERPFRTLTDLQNGSGPGQILFVHGGSVFNGESIMLQNNQRFLGEGIPYTFTATQGTFLLPTATSSTVQPIIAGAPDNAIILASNNEVANFNIVSPARHGIFGTDISGFNIHDNLIDSARRGIYIVDATGTGFITNNTIRNGSLAAIRLDNAGSTSLVANISGNTAINNGTFGIRLVDRDSANVTANISNNQLVNNAVRGLQVDANRAAQVQTNLANNTITGNASTSDGVRYNVSQDAQVNATFSGDVISGHGRHGLFFDIENRASLNANLQNVTITGNDNQGLNVLTLNRSSAQVSMTGGSISGNGRNGLFSTAGDQSSQSIFLNNVAITGNTRDGVNLDAFNRAIVSLNATGGSISNNGRDGLLLTTENQANLFATLNNVAVNGNTVHGVDLATFNQSTANLSVSGGSVSGNDTAFILSSFNNSTLTTAISNNVSVTSNATAGVDAVSFDNSLLTLGASGSNFNLNGVDMDLVSRNNSTFVANINNNVFNSLFSVTSRNSSDFTVNFFNNTSNAVPPYNADQLGGSTLTINQAGNTPVFP